MTAPHTSLWRMAERRTDCRARPAAGRKPVGPRSASETTLISPHSAKCATSECRPNLGVMGARLTSTPAAPPPHPFARLRCGPAHVTVLRPHHRRVLLGPGPSRARANAAERPREADGRRPFRPTSRLIKLSRQPNPTSDNPSPPADISNARCATPEVETDERPSKIPRCVARNERARKLRDCVHTKGLRLRELET